MAANYLSSKILFHKMEPSQGIKMKKASDKTAKKFLVDPEYLDKLKQIKDKLNDQINASTTKKISENDILEALIILFVESPPEFQERFLEYRSYIHAQNLVLRMQAVGVDELPALLEKALSAIPKK